MRGASDAGGAQLGGIKPTLRTVKTGQVAEMSTNMFRYLGDPGVLVDYESDTKPILILLTNP